MYTFHWNLSGLLRTSLIKTRRKIVNKGMKARFRYHCSPTVAHLYFACLSCRLYPLNVETTRLIGPKFWMATHITQRKVYKRLKAKKFTEKNVKFYKSINVAIECRLHCSLPPLWDFWVKVKMRCGR